MKIYMVMFDWSTQDNSDIEVELFDNYQKAYKRFNEIIANEKVFDISWVADAFDNKGNLLENYELDEHIESDGINEFDCWLNITNKNDWNTHDFLDLKVMEVK